MKRQGHRLRHRPRPARRRTDNPRRRIRRQVELRLPRAAGPRWRRRQPQVGYLQFWSCPGGGAARPADRYGGIASRNDRQAARGPRSVRYRADYAAAHSGDAAALAREPPGEHGRGRGVGAGDAESAAGAQAASYRERAQRQDSGFSWGVDRDPKPRRGAYVFRDDLARWAGTFSAPAPSGGPLRRR